MTAFRLSFVSGRSFLAFSKRHEKRKRRSYNNKVVNRKSYKMKESKKTTLEFLQPTQHN